MNDNTRCLLFGTMAFIAGVALGTGAGLLLAPQSGERTRRQFREMLQEASDYAEQVADEVKEAVGDGAQRSKQYFTKQS